VGATIEIVSGDDVVARFEHGRDGVDRRHATAEDGDAVPPFERRRFVSRRSRVGFVTAHIRSLYSCRSPLERRWKSDKCGALTAPVSGVGLLNRYVG